MSHLRSVICNDYWQRLYSEEVEKPAQQERSSSTKRSPADVVGNGGRRLDHAEGVVIRASAVVRGGKRDLVHGLGPVLQLFLLLDHLVDLLDLLLGRLLLRRRSAAGTRLLGRGRRAVDWSTALSPGEGNVDFGLALSTRGGSQGSREFSVDLFLLRAAMSATNSVRRWREQGPRARRWLQTTGS